MSDETVRVQIKRPAKKKVGYEVELRKDGFYYGRLNIRLISWEIDHCSHLLWPAVTATPSKKSSIKPGDRVLEINGVPYTAFKTEKAANELFEKLVLDIIPADDDEEDEEEDEEDSDEDDLD